MERAPLDLPAIAPLQLEGMNWFVITENNFTEVMTKLRNSGLQPVVFALDEKGYEHLSVNMSKIRAYIANQKSVIVALKNYYSIPDNPEALTPPVSRLTQGSGINPAPVVPPAVPAQVIPPAPTASTQAPLTTPPKKGMAKFIPPFVRK